MHLSARSLLLTITLVTMTQALYGQSGDTVLRSFSLGMGAAHYRFIDEAFAHERIKYRGTTFTGDLIYQRATDKSYLVVEAGGSSGSASASDQRPDAKIIYVRLAVSYARYVLPHSVWNASGRLYLGGQLASSNYIIENVREYDELSLSIYNTAGLFVFDQIEISPRNQLQLSLSMPLVGFVKRANYDGGINLSFEQQYRKGVIHVLVDDAQVKIINPLSLVKINIDFVRSIGPNTDFVFSYQYNYLRNTDIAPVILYGNSLLARLRFNFNKDK